MAVIISHDLVGVKKAPPATIQAGQTELVNTVKRKLIPSQIARLKKRAATQAHEEKQEVGKV